MSKNQLSLVVVLADQVHSIRKVNTVLERHGYKYDKGVVTVNSDDSGNIKAFKTPKKSPAKKTKVETTPSPKKRKLNVTESVEDGSEEITGAGEGSDVKSEVEEEGI